MTDCHVENYLHMVNVEKNLSNGGIFHMKNVDTNQFCHNLHCLVAKSDLLQFTLFGREICFVAIYALFRKENLNQNLCLWRKITNIMYVLHIYQPYQPYLYIKSM